MAHPRENECMFYSKVGACRHGVSCTREHRVPEESTTLLCPNFYDDSDIDAFYEDIFVEAGLIAPVRSMLIAANDSSHLRGNLYLQFSHPEDAAKVRENFNSRWYAGRPVLCEFSPVYSLRYAECKDAAVGCQRGNACNYVHPAPVSRRLQQELYDSQNKTWAR